MKLKSILCGIVAIATAAACTEEAPVTPNLNVSRAVASIDAAGGSINVEVTSNVAWTASTDADWITSISPSEGAASDKPVTMIVAVAENTSEQERSATVTVTAGTSATKSMKVTQAGKASENPGGETPTQGTDVDLLVAWAFSTDMKPVNVPVYDQNQTNDLTSGDGGKYINATTGIGKISYVQVDKTAYSDASKVYRLVGKMGEPVSYGVWAGDYFLFEAESAESIPAGANISIEFGVYGGNETKTLKYWRLEYLDGDNWKPAIETTTENGIGYNVEFTYQTENTRATAEKIEATVILNETADKVQFRLLCVSEMTLGGTIPEIPNTVAHRINPEFAVIIKGSAIDGTEDIAAPSLTLSQTSLETDAAGGDMSLEVTSNNDWTALTDADWVTITPSNGTASETAASVKITIGENTSEEARTATITVKAGIISKEIAISQAGKVVAETPDPDTPVIPENKLNVTWTFAPDQGETEESTALIEANKASFYQEESDFTAGDGGKYISSTTGEGKLTFVQSDKSAYTETAKAEIRRHIGKNGEPVIYGALKDDYILFEASDGYEYPAGTKVAISFDTYGNNNGARDWGLEYLDGTEWKSLSEIVMTTKAATYSAEATLSVATSSVKFRLICTSTTTIKGEELTVPKGNNRIGPAAPITIQVVE